MALRIYMHPLDDYRMGDWRINRPLLSTSVYVEGAFTHMGSVGASGLWRPGLWIYFLAMMIVLFGFLDLLSEKKMEEDNKK